MIMIGEICLYGPSLILFI